MESTFMAFDPPQDSALIVVDVQNDFLSEGNLATQPKEYDFIKRINHTMEVFHQKDLPIVFTQDFHPEDHYSFATAHGKEPFTEFDNGEGIGPVLWPDHCVQGTLGSEFAPDLDNEKAWAIIRKGYRKQIDSYSGFIENDGKTETGLYGFLQNFGVNIVYICGLAYDYCVYFTAKDAKIKYGYETYLLEGLTQYVDVPEGSVNQVTQDMKNCEIKII